MKIKWFSKSGLLLQSGLLVVISSLVGYLAWLSNSFIVLIIALSSLAFGLYAVKLLWKKK